MLNVTNIIANSPGAKINQSSKITINQVNREEIEKILTPLVKEIKEQNTLTQEQINPLLELTNILLENPSDKEAKASFLELVGTASSIAALLIQFLDKY